MPASISNEATEVCPFNEELKPSLKHASDTSTIKGILKRETSRVSSCSECDSTDQPGKHVHFSANLVSRIIFKVNSNPTQFRIKQRKNKKKGRPRSDSQSSQSDGEGEEHGVNTDNEEELEDSAIFLNGDADVNSNELKSGNDCEADDDGSGEVGKVVQVNGKEEACTEEGDGGGSQPVEDETVKTRKKKNNKRRRRRSGSESDTPKDEEHHQSDSKSNTRPGEDTLEVLVQTDNNTGNTRSKKKKKKRNQRKQADRPTEE